jgi:hypothetical protein
MALASVPAGVRAPRRPAAPLRWREARCPLCGQSAGVAADDGGEPLMRRRLTILTSLLLTSGVVACLAAPSTAEQQPAHLSGAVYVMPGGFVVTLDSGQTALLSMALVLTGESEREWLTGIEQDRVRRAVTRTLNAVPAGRLLSGAGRQALAARLRRQIAAVGLPVESVLITDLAVR